MGVLSLATLAITENTLHEVQILCCVAFMLILDGIKTVKTCDGCHTATLTSHFHVSFAC